MNIALTVFAKAPLPGLAKTRLAPALGPQGAAALAERLLCHALEQAVAADVGPVQLCATPDASHPLFARLAQTHGVALAGQGDGDLGERMHRALALALQRHDAALLIGSDMPALDAQVLRDAARALQAHDAVFVPALDGGYGLVGLRRADARVFAGIDWSTPQVMAQTRERLRGAGLVWAELPPLADIDTPADLAHLPAHWPEHAPAAAPGRSCPLHYRYAPEVFRAPAAPALRDLEVLYVVGGLYGNEPALQRVLALFERERGRKRLVFNGDFHWFDAEPAMFARVQRAVLGHVALRGNVETELADDGAAGDAGCGCAYPDWVGDAVVERSNRILERLRQAADAAQRTQLAALPMWLRAEVGGLRLGIVHGDAQSLAGWGFAQEHLRDAVHRETVRGWFERAGVDAFACTHTCLPVFQRIGSGPGGAAHWVWNNGAAGMPNFSGDGAGLLLRVATTPFAGPQRRFGLRAGPGDALHAEAIAIDIDAAAWQARFQQLWPRGSDAHDSYFERIVRGPDYVVADAVRL
jgi:rSAM/selenodomain-associated transferase 1